MCNLSIRFVLFACFASLYTVSLGTSLNVLKVAQANFLIVKNETHALIFDCGTKEAGWTERRGVEFTDAKKGLVKNLLAEVKNITILISHNHDDHQNLLIPLINLIKETSTIKCSFFKIMGKNRYRNTNFGY